MDFGLTNMQRLIFGFVVLLISVVPVVPLKRPSSAAASSSAVRSGSDIERTCQPIAIDICKGVGYNHTVMPNLLNHDTQQEAQLSLQSYNPLITYGCSQKLRFFLCSVHTPMCTTNWKHPIGPCRPLCEHVRELCLPVLTEFGFFWPEKLECSRFPLENKEELCMEGPKIPEQPRAKKDTERRDECSTIRNPSYYTYINRTKRCALLCGKHDLFNAQDKYVVEVWMGVLSGLCFISTLVTVLTFLIDSQRFKYPERPIVFLAVCYNLYSISYFVRLIAGRRAISCTKDSGSGLDILIQEGLDNTDCAISFLLQYFFGTASAVWWVMLTLTWLLAAGCKWSHEAIQRRSCCYHSIAWLIPAILTVIVLVIRDVDADELLGMCGVGNQKTSTLIAFAIVPNSIFLVLGAFFLLAGLFALMKIRRHVKSDGVKTDKLEVLMVRIGVFSVLYIVPAACVIACNLYEVMNRESWHKRHQPRNPDIELFMLKTFMSLVVGITSGVWIWSVKTLQSWRNFCDRSFCRTGGARPVGTGAAGGAVATGAGAALPNGGGVADPHAGGALPAMATPDGVVYMPGDGSRAAGHQPMRPYYAHYDAKYSKNRNETVI